MTQSLNPLIKIDFEPESHTYRLDGKPVGGVTTILKNEGFIDTRWYKPSGTSRGGVVHELTELMDRGELSIGTMAGSDVYPYLQAWDQFKKDLGPLEWLLIEKPVGSKLGYAGIPDRIAEHGKEIAIYDIKTGAHELWHGLQLAAYVRAVKETYDITITRRRVVHLKKTGKYSLCDKDKKIGSYDSKTWDRYWEHLVMARSIKEAFAKIKPGENHG